MATILPLEGKYYGTKVQICLPGTPDTDEILVWCPDHFARPFASKREIANGWSAKLDGHDHVEDQQSYKIASVICEALTKAGY